MLCRSGSRHQILVMATYKIVRSSGEDCFDVAVVGSDGARQTLLNFPTEADAAAWIVQDEKHERRRGLMTD